MNILSLMYDISYLIWTFIPSFILNILSLMYIHTFKYIPKKKKRCCCSKITATQKAAARRKNTNEESAAAGAPPPAGRWGGEGWNRYIYLILRLAPRFFFRSHTCLCYVCIIEMQQTHQPCFLSPFHQNFLIYIPEKIKKTKQNKNRKHDLDMIDRLCKVYMYIISDEGTRTNKISFLSIIYTQVTSISLFYKE